jgi:hypothetical protein
MPADITRDSFDALKHFSRVVQQQGRVQLDADWNEQVSILLHSLRTLAADLIGEPACPDRPGLADSFLIERLPAAGTLADFRIRAGRYYVDGLLAEMESDITRNEKGDPVPVSYFRQPHLHRDPQADPLSDFPLLVVLDVWERTVTATEDPSIREVALEGPDTTARAQLIWQVRTARITGTAPDFDDMSPTFDELTELWQPANRGLLKARVRAPGAGGTDPCITAPESRYRGAENQLYRVEIHRGGPAGTEATSATFKWSRDNGSVAFRITRAPQVTTPAAGAPTTTVVSLADLGRDSRLGLRVGDWVEIAHDDATLQPHPPGPGGPAPLLLVAAIDRTRGLVTLEGPAPTNVERLMAGNPVLRRWDHKEGEPGRPESQLVGGAVRIVESAEAERGWIALEDGIEVQFQPPPAAPGGAPPAVTTYRRGDYWLIPARTFTGDLIWPAEVLGGRTVPAAVTPHGVRHHFAPLAIFANANDPPLVQRRKFAPLTTP